MDNLIRTPVVVALTGVSRPAIYAHMQAGIMPPSIRIGRKAVAWLKSEVELVARARIAGANDETIKRLIAEAVEKRPTLAN